MKKQLSIQCPELHLHFLLEREKLLMNYVVTLRDANQPKSIDGFHFRGLFGKHVESSRMLGKPIFIEKKSTSCIGHGFQ